MSYGDGLAAELLKRNSPLVEVLSQHDPVLLPLAVLQIVWRNGHGDDVGAVTA